MSKDTSLTAVSLFSGAGGLDLGFKDAGFKILWANDNHIDSVETYKKNVGKHIVLGDIRKIPSSDIPKNADVLLGGFPCQGFSIANSKKRGMHDKRNFLYLEMLRIIKDTQPKFFVAENVKGLLNLDGGRVVTMIMNDFRNIGYDVANPFLVNSADYGVPQFRERIFIIGNRVKRKNRFPKKSKNGKTTKEVIGHLPEPDTDEGKKIPNHIGFTNADSTFMRRKHPINQFDICDYLKYWKSKTEWSTEKIDRYFGYSYTAGHWFRKDNDSGSIPKPDDWLALKELLGFDDKYDEAVLTFEEAQITFDQSLRITNWDRPSDTITATGPEIHVNKKRRLTVRECAMLQTFPDWFIFTGSISSQYRQVGNAVPPLLAKQIAETIKEELLFGKDVTPLPIPPKQVEITSFVR